MSHEINSEFERHRRLADNKRLFFGAWAQSHAEDIPGTDFLENHPAQALDVFKSPTKLPTEGDSMEDIINRITFILASSFEDQAKVLEFRQALHKPYPYEGGDGRTYIQYAVDEYISRGLSIGGLLVHADDGLTDVPRMTAITKVALAEEYGDRYLSCVAEVASPTLQFEIFNGIPVPDLLELVGEIYWMPPNTPSAEAIRAKLGLSQEDLDELYGFIAVGSSRRLLRDIEPKLQDEDGNQELGRVVYISPPGTRSESEKDANGVITSVDTPPVPQASANLISNLAGLMPVTILNEQIRLGPIVSVPDMRTNLSKLERQIKNMTLVEDMIELIDEQVDDIIGEKGVGKYTRSTERGDAFHKYSRKGRLSQNVGNISLGKSTT